MEMIVKGFFWDIWNDSINLNQMKKFVKTLLILSLAMLLFIGTSQGQTEKELFKRGISKMEIQDYRGAFVDFSMVLKLNPRNDAAYFNRGFSRLRLGEFNKAVQDFNLSLDINPINAEAYYQRGNAKLGLGNHLAAMQDFNIAIKGKPKSSKYFRARAKSKQGLEDYRGSITDLNQAIKLTKGKDLSLIFDRAEAFIALRDFTSAVKDLDRLVKIRPRDPQAYNARATIKMQGGDVNGACLDWSKAGELGDVSAYDRIRKNCNGG